MKRIARLQIPPTLVVKDNCKFLIMDAPSNSNLNFYIEHLQEHRIETLVRTCEPTYEHNDLAKAGIKVIDMHFSDDACPSRNVIEEWLNIVKNENINHDRPVAVHCVAGLGRAPLLVAIALIYFAKMNAVESVELIRSLRRGAINQKQLQYLKNIKCHYDARCVML